MKKITFYSISAIALLVFCFLMGFFTPFNFWTAKQDIKTSKIQVITIGELPINDDQKQALAKQYGFSFYHSGCIVSIDRSNGINQYNSAMIGFLSEKHGENWWQKFQIKMDSIDRK
jgi:hypothetical protein